MNWREILWLVLIGVLIAVCSFLGVQSCNRGKVNGTLTYKLNACLNAPCTVRDSIIHDTVRDTIWRRPNVVTQFVHDTVAAKYCEKFYADSYKYVKGLLIGKIDYEIHSKDCEDQIRFTNVILPIDYRTETKTVVLRDTIPVYKAKFLHHGPYAEMNVNNFQSFPGLGLGYQLIFNDQLTIGIGGMYLDKPYANIRIGILFK